MAALGMVADEVMVQSDYSALHEALFHQAVQEVVESLALVLDQHPEYRKVKILERIIERERVIMFRVRWQADDGELHVNRGFRL